LAVSPASPADRQVQNQTGPLESRQLPLGLIGQEPGRDATVGIQVPQVL